jgi:hypothetical protein
MFWSTRSKQPTHTSTQLVGSPGLLDRAVGTLKQIAGRAFNKPDLCEKGRQQATYGSHVPYEAPRHRERSWAPRHHDHIPTAPTVVVSGPGAPRHHDHISTAPTVVVSGPGEVASPEEQAPVVVQPPAAAKAAWA